MCTCIVDKQQISHIDLREHTVYCKLITVLAQASCHIIHMVTRFIFLAHYSDMMICAIDCRTHQVCCACIHANVFFVSMLLVNCFCNKSAVWSEHKSSKLCVDCHIPHSCRNKYFFVYLTHTFTDYSNIIRLLIRFVRNTDTT